MGLMNAVCSYSMLIDLVLLRRGGRKRPRAEVLAGQPLRGELTVELRDGVIRAIVLPDNPVISGMPILQDCRLLRMRGDEFVISGNEAHDRRRDEGLSLIPQAWWCRLVGGRQMQRDPAPSAAAGAPYPTSRSVTTSTTRARAGV